jgi:hypothetical protein
VVTGVLVHDDSHANMHTSDDEAPRPSSVYVDYNASYGREDTAPRKIRHDTNPMKEDRRTAARTLDTYTLQQQVKQTNARRPSVQDREKIDAFKNGAVQRRRASTSRTPTNL